MTIGAELGVRETIEDDVGGGGRVVAHEALDEPLQARGNRSNGPA